MAGDTGAGALLRAVGLLPDGPAMWGRPLTARSAGIYLVELPAPLPSAPIELTRVGKWIERLPDLRLDGERPTSRAVAARLASLWLPSETVLYVGATSGSVGGRALALAHHVLGDRRPHADGQWLHALQGIEHARIWWAVTDAAEEYLDAVLEAFAQGAASRAATGGYAPGRPAGALVLPWANTRRPTGERQAHGLTGAVAPDTAEPEAPKPGTIVVDLPPASADGATTDVKGSGTVRRAPRVAGAPAGSGRGTRTPSAPRTTAGGARWEAVPVTREAHGRLEAELHELGQKRRPEVVARIKAARELGDLKENAEYQAAREEQSFLEGRIRLIEDRLRNAVLIEEDSSGRVVLGSTVVLEQDGETLTYTVVGSTESDPAAGRISSSSPVGAALLGAVAGADVQVRTPRGPVTYRVVEVR